MNEVLEKVGQTRVDPFVGGAARLVLKDVEW
jgi:hypothetical protein